MELSTLSCRPRTTIRIDTTSASRTPHPAPASLLWGSALLAFPRASLPMPSRPLRATVAHSASRPLSARTPTPSVLAVALGLDNLLRQVRARHLDSHRRWAVAVVSGNHPPSVEEAPLGRRHPSARAPVLLVRASALLASPQGLARVRHQVSVRPQPWARNPTPSGPPHLVSRRSLHSPAALASPRSSAQSPTHSRRVELRLRQAHLAQQALLQLVVRRATRPALSARRRARPPRVRSGNPLLLPMQAHSGSPSHRQRPRYPWTPQAPHLARTLSQPLATRRQPPRIPSDNRPSQQRLLTPLHKQHQPTPASALQLNPRPQPPPPPAPRRALTLPMRAVNIRPTRATRTRLLPASSRCSKASLSRIKRSTGNRPRAFGISMEAGPRSGSPTALPRTTRTRSQIGPTQTRRRLSMRDLYKRANLIWLPRVAVGCRRRPL